MIEIRKDDDLNLNWVKETYNDSFSYDTIRQTDSFYIWLLSLLKIEPEQTLIDVACGQSQLVALSSRMGIKAVGVDYAPAPLQQARRCFGENYVAADGEFLPFADDHFHVVTSIGSLEHYINMAQGVRELSRVLSPSGQALVLLPNTFSLLHNVYAAFKTGLPMDDGQPLQRYATRLQWENLLQENGLHVCQVFKYNREWPRTWNDVRFYLYHSKKIVYLFLSPFIPLNLCCCFVFLCKKK